MSVKLQEKNKTSNKNNVQIQNYDNYNIIAYQSKDRLYVDVLKEYFKNIDYNLNPDEHIDKIIENINTVIEIRNKMIPEKKKHFSYLDQAPNSVIAQLILKLYHVKQIILQNKKKKNQQNLLGIYASTGEYYGTYLTDHSCTEEIERIIRSMKFTATQKDISEIEKQLQSYAPSEMLNKNQDLVAVNNGIFNYKTKKLEPFDPNVIFLTKTEVKYKENPINPIITNKDNTSWNVETWINELSDDKEVVNLLWEILSAVVRPLNPWNKSIWLYSTEGNNGKGTFAILAQNLAGDSVSIPLRHFDNDAYLEPLASTNAIITDENDVGIFIDHCAKLKSITTQDPIRINRKYYKAIDLVFRGFMIQCLNEFPRVKDTSESFLRRQLIVPMNKSFKGIENTDIKQKYLYRKDVLEYVLHKVLHTNFYKLSEPKVCIDALDEYRLVNNIVIQFAYDVLEECVWDLIPYTFLYDLYKAWLNKNAPLSKPLNKQNFITNINKIAQKHGFIVDPKKRYRPTDKLDKHEPLILEYNLTDFINKGYNGADVEKRTDFAKKSHYTGLLKREYSNE